MKKKILPIAIALAVTALFILPGLAFGSGGGGGNGTPSPPPTNPPCDSDGHNNQPPPYGGPNQNSGSCDHGTGNATGGSTGNACPPSSHNPGGDPNCGHGSTSTGSTSTGSTSTGSTSTGSTSTGSTSTTTTTGGAPLNECHWDVTLGGMTVIPGSDIPGALGLHVDLPPDAAGHTTGSLVHACVGVGSVVNPTPTPCPTGTAPIEAQTDQASYVLLCVLL